MKLSARIGSLVAFAIVASSFPTTDRLRTRHEISTRDENFHEDFRRELVQLQQKRLLFDPLTTPIDVSGKHAFKPPNFAAGDQRGPCPGLNALANHGYISRDGVVGLLELISASNTVYGMGIDLITILGVMGTSGVGNPLALNPGFSIGGPTPKSSNLLGNVIGLLGTPRGLQGSHNWIESDSSGTRNDLYLTGNAWTMNLTLFNTALASAENNVISMDAIGKRAAERFEESIATNPLFYYGPYTGLVARNAGYAFAGRLLSNHSKEIPGGQLTTEVYKSFFAVYEENGQLVYKEGWEQIPKNWYRIPLDYGLVNLNVDLVSWLSKYPILGSVGGNMGKVNSFAGLNVDDITGGIINSLSLLEGNNLLCFSLNIVKTFAPNSLSTLFKILEIPLKLVNDAILAPLLDLSCPVFADLSDNLRKDLLANYPGAQKADAAF